jgi:hypothetical protein
MKGILGRPRRRWEDDIEMNIKEAGWEEVDWIYLESLCERGNERSCSTEGMVQRTNGTIMKGRR